MRSSSDSCRSHRPGTVRPAAATDKWKAVQVQELHRPVDVADRRGDGFRALEVVVGSPSALGPDRVDLEAGGVVAHRFERDVRPAQEVRRRRGGDDLARMNSSTTGTLFSVETLATTCGRLRKSVVTVEATPSSWARW